MPVTLKLDHPDFPDDMEFGVSEFGRIKNHGTLEVDDDAVKTFEASMGMSIQEAFANNGLVTVSSGSQQQPQNEPTTEYTAPEQPAEGSEE